MALSFKSDDFVVTMINVMKVIFLSSFTYRKYD